MCLLFWFNISIMSTNNQSLSTNPILPLQRVSLNSTLTNVVLDSDTTNSSLVVNTGSITSLYIDKFANVGINTTTPSAQLEVSSNNGSCLRLRYGTSATAFTNVFMTSGGNLAINPNTANSTISTTASLSIAGTTTIASTIDATSSTNGGALTVSGGMSVAKSLFIGSNLTVSGNLFINGTSTIVNSTSMAIQDNTLILNSAPSGLNQSGLLINRFQTINDTNQGAVVTDAPSLSTTILTATPSTVILATGSSIDNFYQGWWFKTGNQVRMIQSYTGSSRTITLSTNFTNVPLNGASVQLYNKSYAMLVWDETNKFFSAAFTALDSSSNMSIIDYANLNLSTLLATNVNVSNQLSLTNTLDSASTTTGSLVTSGGLGVAKSLYVGTGIYGTIQTSAQPNITSIGTLNSLSLANPSASGSIVQTLTSDTYTLALGARGTTSSSNAGLGFISYNSSDIILLNAAGNVAIGTNAFGYKLNIGGTINSTNYYLNGSLLNLSTLSYLSSVTPGTATASSALVVDSNLSINGITSLRSTNIIIGSTTLTSTEAQYLTGITPGSASANKALILNASGNISGINSLSTTSLVVNGNDVSAAITSSGYLANVTPGTATADTALVVNSSKDINGINVLGTASIVINGSTITSEAAFIAGASVGSASLGKVLVLGNTGSISGITNLGTTNLTLGGVQIGGTEAGYISGITPGVVNAGKALVANSSLNISNLNILSLTGNVYNQNQGTQAQYVGNLGSSGSFWGLGYDGSSTRVRIGICTNTSGSWDTNYATVVANNFASKSDYRLKTNIQESQYGLDEIKKLKPVCYQMNNANEVGLLAHEVQEVVPEVVYGEKDGEDYQSLNYIGLIPVLIKSIQQQNELIERLKKRIDDLENK